MILNVNFTFIFLQCCSQRFCSADFAHYLCHMGSRPLPPGLCPSKAEGTICALNIVVFYLHGRLPPPLVTASQTNLTLDINFKMSFSKYCNSCVNTSKLCQSQSRRLFLQLSFILKKSTTFRVNAWSV